MLDILRTLNTRYYKYGNETYDRKKILKRYIKSIFIYLFNFKKENFGMIYLSSYPLLLQERKIILVI